MPACIRPSTPGEERHGSLSLSLSLSESEEAVVLCCSVLLFRGGKNLGSDARVDTVVQLVIPDLAGGPRLVLDAVLAGFIVGQRLGAGGNAARADGGHAVDGFVVFVVHGECCLGCWNWVVVV